MIKGNRLSRAKLGKDRLAKAKLSEG